MRDQKCDNQDQFRNRRSAWDAVRALQAILTQYPGLRPEEIESCAPIYYPIAVVELALREQTFEDWEGIERSVMELCGLGITDPTIITRTLGLGSSPSYILRVMNGLYAVGLLSQEGTLTETGQQSLRQARKISTVLVHQKFQVDALIGRLLRIEQIVDEHAISDPGETSIAIGHLDQMDGIHTADLCERLLARSNEYIHQPDGVLNTNVVAVEDAHLDNISYACCYMIKIAGCQLPLVYARRFDRTKETTQERYSWKPLYLPSENMDIASRMAPPGEAVPTATERCRAYVMDLYGLLSQRRTEIQDRVDILAELRRIYRFVGTGVQIGPVDMAHGSRTRVQLDARAFRRYRSWILDYLRCLHRDGMYLYTNDWLYGYLVELRSESDVLQEAAGLVAALLDRDDGGVAERSNTGAEHGSSSAERSSASAERGNMRNDFGGVRAELNNALVEQFGDAEYEDLIDRMIAFLRGWQIPKNAGTGAAAQRE